MAYTPLPTHPAQNPSMWTLNQQVFRGGGSSGRDEHMMDLDNIENEVIVVSNNYDHEIVIWPMEAQCSKCNFRAYYQGMEIEPCPRYVFDRNNHILRHYIVFKPVGKIVSEMPFTPEEREKNVECNFCKELFTMYEKHDCPKKPIKTPFKNRNPYAGGTQCGNCLEFAFNNSSEKKEKKFFDKHTCFTSPKNTVNVNVSSTKGILGATEAYASEIVPTNVNEISSFPIEGMILFTLISMLCLIKTLITKKKRSF